MSVVTPCIVLAGGLGTRLRSAVPDLPKCLAPVGGRTFLEIQLETLAAAGIGPFVLSLGHLADAVLEAVQRFRLADRIDCVTEDRPLGTGGAILNALQERAIDEALVANGDTFIDADLAAMLTPLALASGEQARMAVMAVPDRARFGGVSVAGGVVTGFSEKGSGGPGWINAGLYRVHRHAFDACAPGSNFSMEAEIAPRLVAARALHAATLTGSFIDIGVPEDYRRFCAEHAGTAP